MNEQDVQGNNMNPAEETGAVDFDAWEKSLYDTLGIEKSFQIQPSNFGAFGGGLPSDVEISKFIFDTLKFEKSTLCEARVRLLRMVIRAFDSLTYDSGDAIELTTADGRQSQEFDVPYFKDILYNIVTGPGSLLQLLLMHLCEYEERAEAISLFRSGSISLPSAMHEITPAIYRGYYGLDTFVWFAMVGNYEFDDPQEPTKKEIAEFESYYITHLPPTSISIGRFEWSPNMMLKKIWNYWNILRCDFYEVLYDLAPTEWDTLLKSDMLNSLCPTA